MKRTVSVVGSSSVAVEPDIARLTCGVRAQGANAQEALRRSNEAMHAILEALRGAGVDAADMQTNGPHLFPTEQGYAGNNDVSIVVRDLSSIGEVVDAVVAGGGPNVTVHGVAFAIADPDAHLPAARRAAMEAARAIASELAAAGGAAVGEVLTISMTAGHPAPRPMRAEARMASTTPSEAGVIELSVDVDVTYRLIDPD